MHFLPCCAVFSWDGISTWMMACSMAPVIRIIPLSYPWCVLGIPHSDDSAVSSLYEPWHYRNMAGNAAQQYLWMYTGTSHLSQTSLGALRDSYRNRKDTAFRRNCKRNIKGTHATAGCLIYITQRDTAVGSYRIKFSSRYPRNRIHAIASAISMNLFMVASLLSYTYSIPEALCFVVWIYLHFAYNPVSWLTG